MGLEYSRRPSHRGGLADLVGAGFPKSGTTGGTGIGLGAGLGSTYFDTTRGTLWQNEGTAAAPYWSPVSPFQPGMVSHFAGSFAGSTGKAVADTATSALLQPSGFVVLGDGVHETDSGAVVQTTAAGGHTPIRVTASASAAGDLAGLAVSVLAGAGVYQPDENGAAILDCRLTNVSALTARIVGVGFLGLAPVGTTDPVTAATTVTTLVDDDLALLYMASTASDADRIIAAHNKSNAAASQDFSSDTDLNTGVDMAAAGTYQRFRVEIDADGTMRAFIDKAEVFDQDAALDVDEEANPIVYVSSTTTTAASIDVATLEFYTGRV